MHLSIGQGLRLVIQAAYFVLIARSLGPTAYGAFASVVALAAVLGPFSGMGTTNLFIRDVRSGKREPVICWGNGLLITVVSGSLLTVVVLLVNHLFHLKTSYFIVLVVCISDLVFMKITELAAFGFAASNRMKDTSIQSVVISLLRLLAIGILVLTLRHVSLSEWVWAYLVSGMVGTGYAVYRGTALWGRPQLQLSSLREDLSEGLFFSISTSATSIYNDVDKIMLGRLSDFASTGIYSAAYRLIDVSMTPVRSLVSAAYPVFFNKGVGGIRATHPYAKVPRFQGVDVWCGAFRLLMDIRTDTPSAPGKAIHPCRTGAPSSVAYSPPKVLPCFFRGLLIGRGISAHTNSHSGGSRTRECDSKPDHTSTLFMARSGLDELGLRWIVSRHLLGCF